MPVVQHTLPAEITHSDICYIEHEFIDGTITHSVYSMKKFCKKGKNTLFIFKVKKKTNQHHGKF